MKFPTGGKSVYLYLLKAHEPRNILADAVSRFDDSAADGKVRMREDYFHAFYAPRFGVHFFASGKFILFGDGFVMKRQKTAYLTKIGLLSAMATVLMYFDFPLWFAPPFYKIDMSDLCALIGAFALGPLAGVLVEGIKNLLIMLFKGTVTLGIGELSNFVIGCSFVLPAAFIYRHHKSKKRATLGMAAGTLFMATVGSLMNAFVLIPAYVSVMNMPLDAIISMGTAVNHRIHDIYSLVFWAVVPFNLLKGVIVSLITALIYKRISVLLKK